MTTREIPCAASWLVSDLLDRDIVSLDEVARTSVSVHYESGDLAVPVLTICAPGAVRLPNAVVTTRLPAPGPLTVGGGRLGSTGSTWRPFRWWQPPRPTGLVPPADRTALPEHPWPGEVPIPSSSYGALVPALLVGAGPGLTPAGDDVLAAALVTAHAVGDPRLAGWRRQTRTALAARRTTAISWALLHHAMDGYATPELAAFLGALCRGEPVDRQLDALLTVGHTSGGALLAGVLHTLHTQHTGHTQAWREAG